MYLEKIDSPKDIKKLNTKEMDKLAEEIREALFNKLTKHGGHFGPNFGMVEATIALHYVFDSPKDKIVFDVSHQSYPHKILTGRKRAFLEEKYFDEVSGFTSPAESEHDFFTIGHTSTAVSLASGLAKARDLKGEEGNVIAVLGDGSLGGGEALEGVNFLAELGGNFILVLNDNDMSIAENHGGLYKNLKLLRETDGTASCNLFKAMGLEYIYVADGNNVSSVIEALKKVKDSKTPVAVHLNTLKGKGYAVAEKDKESWHYTMPFDRESGKRFSGARSENYGSLTGEFLLKKMKADKSVVAIVAGVPTGIGFTEELRKKAGKQFVDVGIAEEHAVALASGIAKNGGKPVFSTFASFMQRTYDQVSQDLCVNNSPATLLVNGASINGMRDVTHLGIYDIAMLSNIPNLVYLAPVTCEEYFAMLDWSLEQTEYPVAIRIPMNGVVHTDEVVEKDYSKLNKYKINRKGKGTAIIAVGSFFEIGEKTADKIKEVSGEEVTLINPRYITGLDKELLNSLKEEHDTVITIEDGILSGGFGEKIAGFYGKSDMRVLNYGYRKEFLDRYNPDEVLIKNRIMPELIAEDVKNLKRI